MGILQSIPQIVEKHGHDRRQLLDMIREVHAGHGYLADEDVEAIAKMLGIHKIEIHDMATFYHFFSRTPRGRTTIRLCKAVIEKLNGMPAVAQAFEKAVGCRFGETSADGAISLQYISCIGMSDQPPSALINGSVVTAIKPADVPGIVASIREGNGVTGSRVETNLRSTGPVIFAPLERGHAVRSAVNRSPEEVIAEITKSKLRGRGGAGFPTGMKWDFCRKARGDAHYVVCNADEGEPGTFKDRVVFTEAPDLVFEGMTVAGYAVGAREGVVYLRARVRVPPPRSPGGARSPQAARSPGKERLRQRGLRFRRAHPDGRRRVRLRRGVVAPGVGRRPQGRPAKPAAFPRDKRVQGSADGAEQRGDVVLRRPGPGEKAPTGSPPRAPGTRRAPSC